MPFLLCNSVKALKEKASHSMDLLDAHLRLTWKSSNFVSPLKAPYYLGGGLPSLSAL